ncbi:UDP-glucosyltransferase 2 [Manduca sexta]|uniref:UDP-glucosyltransferase 2 n=1 Tax=Manduca sexta TaxID=7130 RepID=UPI00188FE58E|nr:UDP-glucosyltransferase 2 [Manduca sexta]
MTTPLFRVALSFFLCLYTCSAYKVLVVFPLPGKSHGILGSSLVKHLLNFGHEVTYITPFVSERPHPNLQQVDVSLNLNFIPSFQQYLMHVFSVNVPPFSFRQRLQELWTQIEVTSYMYWKSDNAENKEYERLIAPIVRKRGREPPSYYDVKYNASLVLGNSHVSLGQATTVPEAYKAVGGYHVDEEVLPLPPNIQHIMDKAKHGVIFFSMGSQLNSKDIPEDIKRKLLELFGAFKQTVIWKFEEKPDQLPNNVHVLKWAPQQSILAHPNCVLFITHGGQLSTTEAIHFGVPIIGIPVFGDQFVNIARAVNKGFALQVKLSYSLAEDLKLAIQEILNNQIYTEKIKRLSVVYHHRPVKPGTEIVHWAEHVIITQGAPHLRSYGSLVPWYQKLYLDLIVIIIALVLVLKRILKFFFSKKISNSKKNN